MLITELKPRETSKLWQKGKKFLSLTAMAARKFIFR